MPEIGLGIGYERGEYCGITRDWLYWYTENNERYPTPSEQIKQGQIQIERERDRANRLAAKLRTLGIDPDEV
jgi:hypothetical protein